MLGLHKVNDLFIIAKNKICDMQNLWYDLNDHDNDDIMIIIIAQIICSA